MHVLIEDDVAIVNVTLGPQRYRVTFHRQTPYAVFRRDPGNCITKVWDNDMGSAPGPQARKAIHEAGIQYFNSSAGRAVA